MFLSNSYVVATVGRLLFPAQIPNMMDLCPIPVTQTPRFDVDKVIASHVNGLPQSDLDKIISNHASALYQVLARTAEVITSRHTQEVML